MVPLWAAQVSLKLLRLVSPITATARLEETEHFRHWLPKQVAKIVHCGLSRLQAALVGA